MVTLRPLDPAFPVRVEGGATTLPCGVMVSTLLSKSGGSGSKPDRDTNKKLFMDIYSRTKLILAGQLF